MKDKRTSLLQVKVTLAEKKQIEKNAKKIGLEMSSYVRLKCLNNTETTQN